MSAFVALQEKALAFAIIAVDLATKANQATHFAAQSLTCRVPTLVHGDFALSESSAIAEYLDEVCRGQRLYPTEPQLRARARQIQAWLRSDLSPLRQERSTEVVFDHPTPSPLSIEARNAAE